MSIDIRLTSDGDLPQQESFIVGAELIVQNVLVRVKTFLGEDPEDTRRGLPWARWKESKLTPTLLVEIEDLLAAEVLAVPGVSEITQLVVDSDGSVQADVVIEQDAGDPTEATLIFTLSDPVGVAYRITR